MSKKIEKWYFSKKKEEYIKNFVVKYFWHIFLQLLLNISWQYYKNRKLINKKKSWQYYKNRELINKKKLTQVGQNFAENRNKI